MELKEAIEDIKEFIEYAQNMINDMEYERPVDVTVYQHNLNAIDTALKELNNRIPVKKVETIKQELEEKNLEIDFEWDSEDVKIAKYEDKAKLDLCKDLLNKE